MRIGEELHDFARTLFPICRSLTGDGVRETVKLIQQHLSDISTYEVSSTRRPQIAFLDVGVAP